MRVFNIDNHLKTDENKAGYLLAALQAFLEASDWRTLLMAINDMAEVEEIDYVAERAQMSPDEISGFAKYSKASG